MTFCESSRCFSLYLVSDSILVWLWVYFSLYLSWGFRVLLESQPIVFVSFGEFLVIISSYIALPLSLPPYVLRFNSMNLRVFYWELLRFLQYFPSFFFWMISTILSSRWCLLMPSVLLNPIIKFLLSNINLKFPFGSYFINLIFWWKIRYYYLFFFNLSLKFQKTVKSSLHLWKAFFVPYCITF